MAIVLLHVARQIGEPRGWSVATHYAVAFIGAIGLGVLSEGIQSLSASRQAEWSDLWHDILGAGCALGLYATYDRNLSGAATVWREAPRKPLVHAGVALLMLVALSPVLIWSYAYWDRAVRFPMLCQFSSDWELLFVRPMGSDLTVGPVPTGWKKPHGDSVGQIVFYPNTYPGIRIDEPYPDWRGYERFSLEVYSELPEPQTLVLRIDDAHHNQEHADRFNQVVSIFPGLNHIKISLDDIRQAPVERDLDLSQIKTVMLFAVGPSETFSLYVDNLRLE